MKPWEETWKYGYGHPPSLIQLPEKDDGISLAFFHENDEEDEDACQARARLASAAPEMARLLLEWECYGFDEYDACVACHRDPNNGHSTDCRLVAVLRKAGVRP